MSNIQQQRNKRKRKSKRRSKWQEYKTTVRLALIVLLVFWLIVKLTAGRNTVKESDTFYDVYVNGVSLNGYTYEEGEAAVRQAVEERLDCVITLTYEDETWTITPAMLGASMDYTAQVYYAWNYGHTGTNAERRAQIEELKTTKMEFNSELKYEEEQLDEFVAEVASEIDVEPVEASVIVGADEMLSVTQSKNGLRVDTQELKSQIQNTIIGGGSTTIAVEPEVWEPTNSTQSLQDGTTLIATARTTTSFSSTLRTKNVKRALRSFDGYELKPGEQLNFNQVVGKRTVENGFYEATEYDGTEVVEGIGGGACQASTTLYQACLKAGLTIIDRSPHRMKVVYTKPSLDAAVSDTGKNLIVQNDFDYSVFFYTSVDTERAEVKIYGKPGKYTIELEYEIYQDNIEADGYKKKQDTSGKYVYYTTDTPVLYEEGKTGCRSRGYRVYYDAQTGEEVDRQLLSSDYYMPTQDVYWVGIHSPNE